MNIKNLCTKNNITIILISVILFFMGIIFLTTVTSNNNSTVVTNDKVENIDTIKCATYKFEFDGHKYIKFKTSNGEEYYIHDPKCRCQSNKLNNITTVITNNQNNNTADLQKQINALDANNRANFRVIENSLAEIRNEVKKPHIIYRTVTKTVYVKNRKRK